MDKKTIKVNDHIRLEIEKTLDEYPDLSFYGEFSNKIKEWCIDRKMGKLFGESAPEPQKSDRLNELEDKHDQFCWYHEPDDTFEEKEEYEKLYEEYEKAYDFWDEHYGLKVMADVGYSYDSNSYRFFHVNTDGFDSETEEDKIKYATQNWERVHGIITGHWWHEVWQVTIFVDNVEISNDVLGGVESDLSKADSWEILDDMISNAYHNFDLQLDTRIRMLLDRIDNLNRAKDHLPDTDELLLMVKGEL